MKIIDACLEVMKTAAGAMTAREILEEIQRRDLYTFGAKEPLKVLSGTIRENIRKGAPPQIREIERGKYVVA